MPPPLAQATQGLGTEQERSDLVQQVSFAQAILFPQDMRLNRLSSLQAVSPVKQTH